MSGSTSRSNHPNNAPGVPMIFPVWFERLQIKYLNRLIRPFSRRMSGLGVIHHRGRTSGQLYETIITPYRKGSVVAIGLAHGKTNWVKNVLAAGEADIQIGGSTFHLVRPRVVPAGSVDPSLPRMAQTVLKRSGVFVAEIG